MVDAISDLEELAGLDSEWRELAERRGNPFVTPEWFRAWIALYGEEFTPFVPALRADDGRLRGLLPLAIARSGRPRVCRIAGGNLGDRFHPVCDPGDEAEVAAVAGQALADAEQPWSVIALDHVEVDRPWVPALADAGGLRLRTFQREAGELPLIDLAHHESWDEYLGTRSKNFRQQVRRFARRAAKERSVNLRRTEQASELDADLAAFFDLHDRRMGAHGGSSLEAERARTFHADFAAASLERGWLRLWFLEFDGRPVASLYALRLGDRYSYYNSGFDPEESRLSPGLVLLSAVIESALEEGAAIFDFLLGDERYKFRFAERSEAVSDIALARGPAAVVTGAEYGMRRMARKLPSGARERLGGLARRSLLRGRGR